jgi:glyoxylase-like metal-dependent hydrolase (beta-lactamase superfamily II)
MKFELESGFRKIRSIITGVHKVEKDGEIVTLPNHTGAVTYVCLDGKHIIIDTGARGRINEIKKELEVLGLSILDIDYVILTHFHLDHSYNVAHFENSVVIGWSHFWNNGSTVRINDLGKIDGLDGLSIFKTPGHAEEHISVSILIGNKNVVISGDAINLTYVNRKEIDVFSYDNQLSVESANKILEMADIIVPGHGDVICLEK